MSAAEDNLIKAPKPRLAAWLMEPMRRNRTTYWKVAVAAVFINIFGLLTALFTMTVYDRVVPNNAMASLVALSIGLGIVVIFDFILKMLRAYFVDHAGAQIDRDIGESVFDRLLAMRLELKKGSTGALAGMMRELEALRDFFASATLTAVVDVPFILLTLLIVWIIGGMVVIVPALMVPMVILVGWLTHPALERLSARAMGEGLLKQSVLVEAIGGLETVKTSGAAPLLTSRWSRAVELHSDSSLRQRLVAAIGVTFATSAGTISYAGVVIVGVNMIAEQELTMGGLIACSILAGRAIAPLAQISQLLSRITSTRTAYRQINEMMELPPEGPAGDALKLAQCKGKIEFRNVGFRYPGAPERALDALSFTIEPGEHVALLGRVGSGKSTIAKLILGLYPPEDGLIMLDGSDIRQLEPANLRSHVGAVMQESVLADRLGAREYRPRPRRDRRRGDDPRRADFGHARIHGPDRQRLRFAPRRPRRRPVRRPAPVDRHRPRACRPAGGYGDGRTLERDGRADRERPDRAPQGGIQGPHPDPDHPPSAASATRPAHHPDGQGQGRLRRTARQCPEADHATATGRLSYV